MKFKSLFTVTFLLFVGTAFGQTPNPTPNHMLFSPLYFFDGTFMLTYERLFASGSLRITPSIKLQNLTDQDYSQREGWGLDMGYKFFFTKRLYPANFYMGPYALYKNIRVKVPYDYDPMFGSTPRFQTDTYNIMSFGVDSGIKFIFGRFTMDISFGGGIRYAYVDGYTYKSSRSEWFDIDYKGIVPRGNISFGVAF